MGVFTDVMQDKIRRDEKSRKELIKEIDILTKKLEEKENNKTTVADKKQELKGFLQQYFYNFFIENVDGLSYNTSIDGVYYQLLILSKKYEIIKQIAQNNNNDIVYLDNIYKSTLTKVYNSLKDEQKAVEALKPKRKLQTAEDWENIKRDLDVATNTQLVQEFLNNKNTKKQNTKKGFFEMLLNILLK